MLASYVGLMSASHKLINGENYNSFIDDDNDKDKKKEKSDSVYL